MGMVVVDMSADDAHVRTEVARLCGISCINMQVQSTTVHTLNQPAT